MSIISPSDLTAGSEQVRPAATALPARKFWPRGWWELMEMRVGIIPVPVVVALLGLIAYFLWRGKLPTEICMMIGVIGVGGFVCAEIGAKLPLLRHVGGPVILAMFIPSALIYYKQLPPAITKSVADFTNSSQFLYLFITALIVGSILGMDRNVLIRGFLKIFLPLGIGSVAAIAVGTIVGVILGLGASKTLLFIVIPIMAGGIGEGAIPLSVGYADIMQRHHADVLAMVLPAVIFGNLTATVLGGLLNFIGKKYPSFTGDGRLEPGEHDEVNPEQHEVGRSIDVDHIAAAGMFAVTLYLLGLAGREAFGFPAPVAMLFLAVIAKLTHAVPPKTQQGAYIIYRFFRVAITYPLLFALGVTLVPWDKMMDAFYWKNLITIVVTVCTLVSSGWFVGRWIKLYPVESAILNACHSGMGGTGDVAVLTAANRMQLMPFAQVATRIGGAITITLTLLALHVFWR
jgi:CCS family citrate carrier protein